MRDAAVVISAITVPVSCRHLCGLTLDEALIELLDTFSYCCKLGWVTLRGALLPVALSNKSVPCHCVVAAMSEEGGRGFGTLGFQEAQARELAAATGFTRFEVLCCIGNLIIAQQLDRPVHWRPDHTWT